MSLINRLLKKIFPIVFLKRTFLICNQIKGATWDKIFFRKEEIHDQSFIILQSKNPFRELQIDTSLMEKNLQNKFAIWDNPGWVQDQYLLRFKKQGYIEPKTGWGITRSKKLIYPSLGFASAEHVHKPGFFESYFKKKNIVRIDKIISFRDTGEENYFHYFNDILAKVFFLRENNLNIHEYIFVVGERLYSKSYFKYFLDHTYLGDLNWHIQKQGQWIEFREAIFCKPFTHTKKYFDEVNSLLNNTGQSNKERRIFITRSRESLRFIENFHEIEPILRCFNFEIVDASEISFEAQIDTFSACRYLIAIHGAGLTNMIFRNGKKLSLLEVMHPMPYIPFHYIMLSKMYGYHYEVIEGFKGKLWGKGGFRLDPHELTVKINKMLIL